MNVNPPAATPVVLPFTKARTVDAEHPPPRHLPGLNWLPDRLRNNIIAMIGEFCGTFLFLFFAFSGTQIANSSVEAKGEGPNVSVLLYISLSFGFSLAVTVWVFFRISGGLFNPAVSFPLVSVALSPA
jgi:aquaporin related protein